MRLSKTIDQEIGEMYEKMLVAQTQPKEEPKQELQEAKGKPYEQWKTNPAFRAIKIDLYTGKPKELMAVVEKIEPWLEYTRPSMSKDGKIVTYRGDEYMIVITGNR